MKLEIAYGCVFWPSVVTLLVGENTDHRQAPTNVMLQASVGKLTQSSFLINNMDISFNYEVRN